MFTDRKTILSVVIALSLVGGITASIRVYHGAPPYSIELQEFRWNAFPLEVLVDMNQWSVPGYALAVREALDSWVNGVWNYTSTYTNMTLRIDYIFYVSTVNSTSIPDILVSFAADELMQDPPAVGLTTFMYDVTTHTPQSPVVINITTYSATANHLFVRNVAMHEFGHALGVGHASASSTMNGPEVMYPTLSLNQMMYPSTLDVYGLSMLYQGHFGETVYLPSLIPYTMLEGSIPPPSTQTLPVYLLFPATSKFQYLLFNPLELFYQPTILLIPSILWMSIAFILGLGLSSGKKGFLVAITASVLIAYFTSPNDLDPLSYGLKIIPLVPAMMVGASTGAFLVRRAVDNEEPPASTIPHESFDEWP